MAYTGILVLGRGAALSLALSGISFAQTADPAPAPAAEAPVVATLPGGASSINDVFGSWTVACAAEAAGPRCAVTQVQVNQKSGQRVLGAEMLRTEASGAGAEGIVMLPFGLALDKGAAIELGDAREDLAFSTCVPGGCVLPVKLDAEALAGAESMTITATVNDSGEPQSFTVPLNGLAQALDRMDGLLGSAG